MDRKAFFFTPPFESNYWAEILTEIYKDRTYAPFIEGKNLETCVSIGANVGLASYYFSQHFKKVYAIEPSSKHFTTLNYMLSFNKITNVETFKVAISNKDGKAPFYETPDNQTMFSLMNNTGLNTKVSEIVETKTLETFFTENKIEHVDFMKLDVEGSEASIVGSEGFANVSSKIDLIIGESHSWMDRNYQQFKDSFINNGFSFEKIPGEATLFVAKRIK